MLELSQGASSKLLELPQEDVLGCTGTGKVREADRGSVVEDSEKVQGISKCRTRGKLNRVLQRVPACRSPRD